MPRALAPHEHPNGSERLRAAASLMRDVLTALAMDGVGAVVVMIDAGADNAGDYSLASSVRPGLAAAALGAGLRGLNASPSDSGFVPVKSERH